MSGKTVMFVGDSIGWN
ncbi:hypothetical protein LINPERPRIM_LOCUS38764 [Linum perenne]